jgi:hypothetical protein
MLENAIDRIPAGSHWDIFRQAERQHPDLIASLAEEIRKNVAALDEVSSTAVGGAILPKWSGQEEWNRLFASVSSNLFGMVMWVALFDDTSLWSTTTETVNGRPVRTYRRVGSGDLPEATLHQLADDLFLTYDAEEAARADAQPR